MSKEKKFFTSAGFIKRLRMIANMNAGKRVPVSVMYDNESDVTAYTDNTSIVINAGNEGIFPNSLKIDTKRLAVMGVLSHELGHIHYTRMDEFLEVIENLEKGDLTANFSEGSDAVLHSFSDEFVDWVEDNPGSWKFLVNLFANWHNILEDGYLEPQMIANTAGDLKDGLTVLRAVFAHSSPSLSDIDSTMIPQAKAITLDELRENLVEYAESFQDYLDGNASFEQGMVFARKKGFEDLLLNKLRLTVMNVDNVYDEKGIEILRNVIGKLEVVNGIDLDTAKDILSEIKGDHTRFEYYDRSGHWLQASLAVTLFFAKYGFVKRGDSDFDHPALMVAGPTLGMVDNVVNEHDDVLRLRKIQGSFAGLEKALVSILEEVNDDLEAQNSFNEALQEMLEEMGGGQGTSQGDKREGSSASGSSSGIPQEGGTPMRADRGEVVGDSSDEIEEIEEAVGKGDGSGNEESSGEDEGDSSSEGNSSEGEKDQGDQSERNAENVSDGPVAPNLNPREKYADGGSELSLDDYIVDQLEGDVSPFDKSHSEINKILDEVRGHKDSNRNGSDYLTEEAAEMLKNSSGEHPHGNYRVKIVNYDEKLSESTKSDLAYMYEREFSYVKAPARRLTTEVRKVLEKRKIAQRRANGYTGNRIDASRGWKRDRKIFKPTAKEGKNEMPEISMLVDLSGSMSSGGRLQYSKRAVILMEHFCEELSIPYNVYGHYDSDQTYINIYRSENNPQKNDFHNVMAMDSRGANRDGLALRWSLEELYKKKDGRKKVLFILSDGEPASSGYYGRPAAEDIRRTVEEYDAKGVQTIACAIGDDADVLKSIYGEERFLDCTDLKTLPDELAIHLRRIILGY